MKVILLKNVPGIGSEGDVKDVKDGFARNFLVPQKLALTAQKENFKEFENLKARRTKEEKTSKEKLIQLKKKIETVSITIPVQVKDEGELYGAISQTQIFNALKEEGVDLAKDQLSIDTPIKKIGVYNLPVKLGTDIEASLKVWIVKK